MVSMQLKTQEQTGLKLRELYRLHGYKQFKMNQFEEYDLYVRNKDFLICDSVITFTDTSGRLMALKPDVTLSIIKNTKNINGQSKVYYDENVYRISDSTKSFKEIKLTPLDCAVYLVQPIRIITMGIIMFFGYAQTFHPSGDIGFVQLSYLFDSPVIWNTLLLIFI